MNTTTESPLNPSDMVGLFSKYRALIITGTLLSVAVFMTAAYVLPKKYKSSFELSIYSSYFQNPLTRDFMSETNDTAEMRAQRESIIRQSLNTDYLDTLGTKYGIYGVRT